MMVFESRCCQIIVVGCSILLLFGILIAALFRAIYWVAAPPPVVMPFECTIISLLYLAMMIVCAYFEDKLINMFIILTVID